MISQDEDVIKLFISRYEQSIFALSLYLIGGNRDKAYDITSKSFVKAIENSFSLEKKDIFFLKLVKVTVEQCQRIKVMPSSDGFNIINASPMDKESLRIVKDALQRLTFESRALLLLRDQLHLSYKDISNILRIPNKDVRSRAIQAQMNLRKKIKDGLL